MIEMGPTCKNCHLNVKKHAPNGKCLFEPTTYEELILVIYPKPRSPKPPPPKKTWWQRLLSL